MPVSPAIPALLSRQDGLLCLDQAVAHGLSASTIARRVRRGEWERVLPRVFLAAGHPFTDRARVRAVSLWAGDRAVVSGVAAAWWHGMQARAPAKIEVTVPRQRGLRAHQGIRVRRRDLDVADLLGTDGVWLTDKPLTALETAIAVPDGSVFLDRALQKHVGFGRVYRAYCRNMGAWGAAGMADLLIAAADRADSAAERLLVTLLRAAGLTGWKKSHPFGRWRIDIAFPAARLAVEVDGWAWHTDVDRFRADRLKGNALVGAAWNLLRFTWHDLTNRPTQVIADIRASLSTTPF